MVSETLVKYVDVLPEPVGSISYPNVLTFAPSVLARSR